MKLINKSILKLFKSILKFFKTCDFNLVLLYSLLILDLSIFNNRI